MVYTKLTEELGSFLCTHTSPGASAQRTRNHASIRIAYGSEYMSSFKSLTDFHRCGSRGMLISSRRWIQQRLSFRAAYHTCYGVIGRRNVAGDMSNEVACHRCLGKSGISIMAGARVARSLGMTMGRKYTGGHRSRVPDSSNGACSSAFFSLRS